jgi:hypothetical protein
LIKQKDKLIQQL